jgi:hypothetical protein
VRYEFFFMQASGSQLRELGALYDAGVLRPIIDRTFPFDQTTEAMAYVEQGRTRAGKVVITMPSPPDAGRPRTDAKEHLPTAPLRRSARDGVDSRPGLTARPRLV